MLLLSTYKCNTTTMLINEHTDSVNQCNMCVQALLLFLKKTLPRWTRLQHNYFTTTAVRLKFVAVMKRKKRKHNFWPFVYRQNIAPYWLHVTGVCFNVRACAFQHCSIIVLHCLWFNLVSDWNSLTCRIKKKRQLCEWCQSWICYNTVVSLYGRNVRMTVV